MTDVEICDECEEIWKVKNTWGLSYEDLIKLSYVKGEDGSCNNPSDTVYVSPEGNEMSRFMCSYWHTDWRSFSHGYITARRLGLAEVATLQKVLQRIIDEGCYEEESNIGNYCRMALGQEVV